MTTQNPPVPPGAVMVSPQPSPARRNRGAVIVAVIVALALVAGAVTFFAYRALSSSAGADSPQQAVENLVAAIDDGDMLGAVAQLDPAEARGFTHANDTLMSELVRLGVVRDGYDYSKPGISISFTDVTYGDTPATLGADLAFVTITGGTVTAADGEYEVPFTDAIIAAAPELGERPDALPDGASSFDLADATSADKSPLRLATVQRDGGWYVSLAYTIADQTTLATQGAGYRLGTIPANGAASPAAVADELIAAAVSGDSERIIELASPTELAVLHDYGSLLIDGATGLVDELGGLEQYGAITGNIKGFDGLSDVSVDAEWTTSAVAGADDRMRVSLGAIAVTAPELGEVRTVIDRDAGTVTVTAPGEPTMILDGDNVVDMLFGFGADAGFTSMPGDEAGSGDSGIPAEVKSMISRGFSALLGIGMIVEQGADGAWYYTVGDSTVDLLAQLLGAFTPEDVTYLLSLAE